MDRPEAIVASRRVARFDEADQRFIESLPEREREIVLLLVAHLDATPVAEEADASRS